MENTLSFVRRPRIHYSPSALGLSVALGCLAWPVEAESPALETARQLNQAFIEVVDSVSPAVVVIEVAHRPEERRAGPGADPLLDLLPPEKRRRLEDSQPPPEQRPGRGAPVYDSRGSGLVIREDGWILTNEHVVRGAEQVRVRLKNGDRLSAEGRWYTDPQSDIAVVKIDRQGLTPARLGDSDRTRVGEFAIAIGAPFDLDYSVTFGHVSAKGRSHVLPPWMGSQLTSSMDQDFIQTDASVNPGNSGGPLVNINGEVMGINTLVEGSSRGIGFAIPINLAMQVAGHLIAEGRFPRAWLGLQISALSEDDALRDWMQQTQDGVVVRKIIPNGPASRSGLRPADVITAVEGVGVATAQQLRNQIRARKIGSAVKLDVVRPGPAGRHQALQFTLRTEEWPGEDGPVARPSSQPVKRTPTGMGVTVQTLNQPLADQYGIEFVPGVVITAVQAESPAAQERLKPGDVITQVDRKPVLTAEEFQEALRERTPRGLLLDLVRDGLPEFRILKDGGD